MCVFCCSLSSWELTMPNISCRYRILPPNLVFTCNLSSWELSNAQHQLQLAGIIFFPARFVLFCFVLPNSHSWELFNTKHQLFSSNWDCYYYYYFQTCLFLQAFLMLRPHLDCLLDPPFCCFAPLLTLQSWVLRIQSIHHDHHNHHNSLF